MASLLPSWLPSIWAKSFPLTWSKYYRETHSRKQRLLLYAALLFSPLLCIKLTLISMISSFRIVLSGMTGRTSSLVGRMVLMHLFFLLSLRLCLLASLSALSLTIWVYLPALLLVQFLLSPSVATP